MISFRPLLFALTRACTGLLDVESVALERWTIAPATKHYITAAKYLPEQLDRVRGSEFASIDDTMRVLRGRYETLESETFGFRLKSVDLVDGVLYARRAERHLRSRHHHWPAYMTPPEVASGALYESWVGNRWFGSWLTDDCLTYRLAEQYGVPMTTTLETRGHVPDYEARLRMRPVRVSRAHFDELFLFGDGSHNDHKKDRGQQYRELLTSGDPPERHPGVFLLRGETGARRVLTNERAIADMLASKRGFRVLDPSTASLDEIVAACGGARVVAGVEGSHLVHGLMIMPPDATLFVIQPPHRVVSVLKLATDRQGQTYAFVVGEGGLDEFSVSEVDVERTLDLLET
jgi:hypothetical protein